MNILDQRPERLAETSDPADVLTALQESPALSAAQVKALDYAVSHWVTDALGRPADIEGLLLLDQLCALAVRRAGVAGPDFESRLAGWRTLMENKRLVVQGRESGRARRLLQTQPLLGALADGTKTQAALADELGVSAGRISQLLAVLEEGGLVQRQRLGRENRVSLPDVITAPAKPARPSKVVSATTAGTTLPRGADIFQLRPAA
jgi:DNA-binding transcriptional ArsR family regulator